MSVVAFIRRMLDAGFSHDDALRAAEAFEATTGDLLTAKVEDQRTKWREKKAAQRAKMSPMSEGQPETTGDIEGQVATPENGTPFSQEYIPPSPPKGGSSPTGDRSLAKPPRKRREGSRFCPADFEPSPDHHAQAAARGLSPGDIERALSRFRRHEFPRPYTDWSRCFANWIDREKPSDDRHPSRTAKSDHLDAVARAMVAACDRPEGERGGHSPEPGFEGGGGGFASAA